LKFAILFTIVDVLRIKKKTNACYQRIIKIRNIIFIHPFLSFTLVKILFIMG